MPNLWRISCSSLDKWASCQVCPARSTLGKVAELSVWGCGTEGCISGHAVGPELLKAFDKKFGDMGTVVHPHPNNGVGALHDRSANGKWSPSEKLTLGFGCLGLQRTDLSGWGGITRVSFSSNWGLSTGWGTATGWGTTTGWGAVHSGQP